MFFIRGRHYVSCMPVDTSVTGTLQEGPASRAMALALSAFKGECRPAVIQYRCWPGPVFQVPPACDAWKVVISHNFSAVFVFFSCARLVLLVLGKENGLYVGAYHVCVCARGPPRYLERRHILWVPPVKTSCSAEREGRHMPTCSSFTECPGNLCSRKNTLPSLPEDG